MAEEKRRKRKWDVDAQGESKEEVAAEAVPVLDVTEIAAKIKAKLEAISVAEEPKPVEPSKVEDTPVDHDSKQDGPEEPSLLESLGIKTDPTKGEKKIKADEAAFVERLDINDTRHRYYLTKEATQEAIEIEFDVKLKTKGKYYPNRALATEKDPPLQVEIYGTDEAKVKEALAKLKEMAEKGPTLPPPSSLSSLTTSNFFAEKIFIDIEASEAVPAFTIRGKILGPQGSFLKHIQTQTGCKVHLRGRGSGYVELGEEVSEELHLFVTGLRKEDVEQAKTLAQDLLTHVRKDVEQMNAARLAAAQAVLPPPGQYYGYQGPPYYPSPYQAAPGYAPPYPPMGGYPPVGGSNPYVSPPHAYPPPPGAGPYTSPPQAYPPHGYPPAPPGAPYPPPPQQHYGGQSSPYYPSTSSQNMPDDDGSYNSVPPPPSYK